MANATNRVLFVFVCLSLSYTVQAQTTSKELYEKWRTIYNGQKQKGNKQQRTIIQPQRKRNTVKSNTVKPPQPVAITQLRKYNVVAVSYELLSNAQRQCRKLREQGYPAQIYLDSKEYYRVIPGSFNSEREALNFRESIFESFPESWILCVENGNEERYVQKRNHNYNHIYELVYKMPSFPGGDAMLMKYLSENIKYPVVAEENGIQGRVICTFVVERDGSISELRVAKSVDPSLDMEALRVLSCMPKWIPGVLQDGSAVRVKYTVPISFRLQ